jgi:hypothetical protein
MKNLLRLITDTTVYREISQWSSVRLLGTYFLLYSVVAIATAGSYFAFTQPELQSSAQNAWQNLAASWPENLVLQYKNGELSASPSATIKVAYPEQIPPTEGLPSTLLTLSTETEERPTENDSLIVITKKELGTLEAPGTYQWLSLSEIFESNEMTLNKTFVEEQTPGVHSLITIGTKVLGLLIFIGTAIFLPLIRAAVASLFAFLTPTIFGMFGNSKNWKVAWKVGLILLPLAEAAQLAISTLTRPNSLHIFWIIWLLMIVLVNACNQRKIG